MARLNCVTVLAPAKLNLALDVVGLLPNGTSSIWAYVIACCKPYETA